MDHIVFNTTSPGASHKKNNKECQDYSTSTCSNGSFIAITCDGHGGDNYFRSAQGAEFAAMAATNCIEKFLKERCPGSLNDPDNVLRQLEKSIITRWNELIWGHYKCNSFSAEELNSVSEARRSRLLQEKSIESTYGTTLIAIVLTNWYWFALQIGDGKMVRIDEEGYADFPVPANDKCFLNSTTSICDTDALENFRHYYSDLSSSPTPVALFCGTDGIDDSFSHDDQLFKLYSTIGQSFAYSKFDDAKKELEDYLPRLSLKGSKDDVSIAGIINLALAKTVFPPIADHVPAEQPTTKENSPINHANKIPSEPQKNDSLTDSRNRMIETALSKMVKIPKCWREKLTDCHKDQKRIRR